MRTNDIRLNGRDTMDNCRLGEMEEKFADLIWERQPVGSGELVRLCAERFGWKKSTTYTMLKRLCGRGLFENNGGTVKALLKREEFHAMQGEELIEKSFDGSLPRFLAAFTRRNRLSQDEVEALQKLIDEYKE